MSLLTFYCVLMFSSFSVHLSLQSIVTMAQGRMRGLERDGYVSYVGVPYASLNENGRYKKAGIAPTWTGIRESRDPYCTSRSEVQDCLQLDVHLPKVGKSWPILVWVKGSSGDYQAEKLVLEHIIVVMVRHRLGAVGFMCSRGDNIPGNAGVKDVVLALRWVRDNIVAFKGNPHRVVVAGQSFGAAMVEALTLSPMASGLYHGMILQSGTVLAPWAFNYDANNKTEYIKIAMNGTQTLLKSAISDVVLNSEDLDVPYYPFGICVENAFKNEERLLSEAPFNSFIKGKFTSVPTIIGYNSNEAYVFVSTLKQMKAFKRMKRDATFLLPVEIQSTDYREMHSLNKRVTDVYFGENMTISSMLEYHRDVYFMGHIHRSAIFHATTGPVYYYQFSHLGKIGVEPVIGVEKNGAAHSDELAYLFPNNVVDFDGDDATVHQHLTKLWTSFVKNLNPNSEHNGYQWSPLDPYEPRLLEIKTEPRMIDFPNQRQAEMWREIYEKHFFRRH